MATTSCELNWIRFLIADLHMIHHQSAILYYDNHATLYFVANLMFHEKTKQIEQVYHLIKDNIVEGSITTNHVPTHLQQADLITKALPTSLFDLICAS